MKYRLGKRLDHYMQWQTTAEAKAKNRVDTIALDLFFSG